MSKVVLSSPAPAGEDKSSGAGILLVGALILGLALLGYHHLTKDKDKEEKTT